MENAALLIGLAVGVLAVTALAERVRLPPPLLLIVAGVAASYLPGVEVHLSPELVLLGLLPPLLYATSIQASLVDFNANRRAILLLSVGLVAFTTAGVAVIVHTVLTLDWPSAFAIGAVVAPPDAVAASAIGRRIGLPRRIVTILEGESLLNDATALVALRTAIAAGAASVTAVAVGLDFLIAAGGGLGVGCLAYALVARLRPRITDSLMDTAISFVVPYAAYLGAESLHASGVVAVVVAGLLLGHKAPILQTAPSRIAERTTWRTIAFLLENAVFLLIGLQSRTLFSDVAGSSLDPWTILGVCAATLAGVIVLRMAWVFATSHLLVPTRTDPAPRRRGTWRYTFLLGWAGMRGVVTLAAAFVIPATTPHREVLLLVAFTVVAGTLFIQGLSLPWLARRLHAPAPDPLDDALARATVLQQASKAGFEALDRTEFDDPHGVEDLIRQRTEQRNFAAWERLGTTVGSESPSDLYARLRRLMLDAERARVLEIRSSGTVASEVIADVLATLDVEESMLDAARPAARGGNATGLRRTGLGCAHLDARPATAAPPEPVCQECLEEGVRWVALRQCLDCGNVGCCDSSPNRHASAHFRASGHPVMQSAEPGEDWRWCYIDHLTA